MFAYQLRTALRIAWLAVSLAVGVVLLAPLVLPQETIYALAPVCQWRAKYNRECIFCGMTASFIAISRGDFETAAQRNKGSIPLYLALVANQCAALWFALGQLGRIAPGRYWATEELSCRH
ncbi:MAG: DUF2752 domain-containing protein [Bryobacteraceae bacterium]